jgi:hypothetical protein
MKKIIITALLLTAAFAAWGQQKPRVAVATFGVTGEITAEEANIVTELFIAELVSTGRVDVIDPANFDRIIVEMNFQTSDWSDRQKTAQLGGILDVQYIIRGQLMKMAAVYYWTATMMDIETAQVLSSAREQLAGMWQVFYKLPAFCKQISDKIPFDGTIGDRGPGGGIVFVDERGAFMECSEILGQYYWHGARSIAENYRGGGFTDWRLPTMQELNLMYQNLRRKKLGGMGDNVYWSSSEYGDGHAWYQRFSDGKQGSIFKSNSFSVRAVRAFSN